MQLESQKKELELRGEELEKRETQNENDRKILAEEIEKVLMLVLGVFLFWSYISCWKKLKGVIVNKFYSLLECHEKQFASIGFIGTTEG